MGGIAGQQGGKLGPYGTEPDKPVGSWNTAWRTAKKTAGVECRWHDLRHTFVSTIAAGGAMDATIMSLAGHLSRKMMEKYSHVRNAAKRQAVAVFDGDTIQ
jgi:integrase